ncbi:hypothetical protein [Ectobacillus polymachus]|uniref:hypothetical protein n=1 Tax=Ectobacillus polymachus TaxID=1508806 RepID=UPI003A88C937
MIIPYFNHARQAGIGAAITWASMQPTFHGIHQMLASHYHPMPVIYPHAIHPYITDLYGIHPIHISTIPFGLTYYV